MTTEFKAELADYAASVAYDAYVIGTVIPELLLKCGITSSMMAEANSVFLNSSMVFTIRWEPVYAVAEDDPSYDGDEWLKYEKDSDVTLKIRIRTFYSSKSMEVTLEWVANVPKSQIMGVSKMVTLSTALPLTNVPKVAPAFISTVEGIVRDRIWLRAANSKAKLAGMTFPKKRGGLRALFGG